MNFDLSNPLTLQVVAWINDHLPAPSRSGRVTYSMVSVSPTHLTVGRSGKDNLLIRLDRLMPFMITLLTRGACVEVFTEADCTPLEFGGPLGAMVVAAGGTITAVGGTSQNVKVYRIPLAS